MKLRKGVTEQDIAEGWGEIQRALGPELGEHLAFTRAYLGDENFIRLAAQFSAGEVIVASGITNAAAVIEFPLRPARHQREQRLFKAIRDAHARPR